MDILKNIEQQVARTKVEEEKKPSTFSLKVSPSTYEKIKQNSKEGVVKIAGVYEIKPCKRIHDDEFHLNPNRA